MNDIQRQGMIEFHRRHENAFRELSRGAKGKTRRRLLENAEQARLKREALEQQSTSKGGQR